ncbi:hypothetical protein ABE562_04760 [Brucella intermedia]|uniref:Uncharacterized protein n=1 Tax=Brucella intermedia GD04153 TaxID=2975438 RepID=A0AA42H4C6_9HYPH|nr:hypothetical protein [Brucella intermedia]MDH0123276.1 hypothetical protein [Brucella intermedia GD04153]
MKRAFANLVIRLFLLILIEVVLIVMILLYGGFNQLSGPAALFGLGNLALPGVIGYIIAKFINDLKKGAADGQ